jgi:hypothetical protein
LVAAAECTTTSTSAASCSKSGSGRPSWGSMRSAGISWTRGSFTGVRWRRQVILKSGESSSIRALPRTPAPPVRRSVGWDMVVFPSVGFGVVCCLRVCCGWSRSSPRPWVGGGVGWFVGGGAVSGCPSAAGDVRRCCGSVVPGGCRRTLRPNIPPRPLRPEPTKPRKGREPLQGRGPLRGAGNGASNPRRPALEDGPL